MIVIDARARDSAGNWSIQPPVSYRLARRPSLTDLAPAIGPASGGTLIEVKGIDFVEPVDGSEGTQLLIDGRPIPLETISPTRITAKTPSHDSGSATITVSNGGAESLQMKYFQFVDRPLVKLVTPASGPLSGGTWIKVVGNNFRARRPSSPSAARSCCAGTSRARTESWARRPSPPTPGPVAVTATDDDGGSDTLDRRLHLQRGRSARRPDVLRR